MRIFDGDIIAHCVDGGGIEYHSKVEFNQQRGMFEFVCIEHPAISDISSLPNPNIEVIGNIHENPELLGE
ncbi:YopX family protein [Helicobacter apodemus]|uniref:YopX family protein n=1 Tax=Helicobacter apodemus TaxID=135569 RepID=UPI001EF24D8F|nr:YopX family protein [Helicobacter apodemus]